MTVCKPVFCSKPDTVEARGSSLVNRCIELESSVLFTLEIFRKLIVPPAPVTGLLWPVGLKYEFGKILLKRGRIMGSDAIVELVSFSLQTLLSIIT